MMYFYVLNEVNPLRVISGSARGRKLSAPEGLDTRPTTERVKESIFNIISPYLPATNILDLFAGSGAMGIEALSRAGHHAVFVEQDEKALSVIKKNLQDTRLYDRAEVIRTDAFSFLQHNAVRFDIIFLDPPYNKGLLTKAMDEIYRLSLLSDNGIIVAESEYGGELPSGNGFDLIKQAKYGKTVVSVFRTISD